MRLRTTCTAGLLPLLLLTQACPVQAQFDYATNNGTITIAGYFGPGGAVAIPGTIHGLPVTRVGPNAFYGKPFLISITIPDSVTSIGYSAFFNCPSLTSVTIPNSVTNIEFAAFAYCPSLTSVRIGNSVNDIGSGAFSYCTGLGAITVDALNSFYSSVDGVLFNKSQTLLIQCPGGKAGSFTIPNGVIRIEGSAFQSCASLASVTIPASVTNIGYVAFRFCANLSAITVSGLNAFYSSVDGVLFNKSQTLLIQCPAGKGGSFTIPNGVTTIGDYAFSSCTRLTSVTIPESVTYISYAPFEYCTGFTGLYFKGNAPGAIEFGGTNNVTVYYLPGSTGWGWPAVLWNPMIRTTDASFGMRTNQFGFTITGSSDLVLVVEASTNLTNPAWTPVATNTLTGGSSYFSDPGWTNHPVRFYRLRSP